MNNLANNLRNVESTFNNNWTKVKKRILAKVSIEVEGQETMGNSIESEDEPLKKDLSKKDQEILEKFQEEKFTLYEAHLKEHLPKQNLPMTAIEALVQLLVLVSLIDAKLNLKNRRI